MLENIPKHQLYQINTHQTFKILFAHTLAAAPDVPTLCPPDPDNFPVDLRLRPGALAQPQRTTGGRWLVGAERGARKGGPTVCTRAAMPDVPALCSPDPISAPSPPQQYCY